MEYVCVGLALIVAAYLVAIYFDLKDRDAI